MGEESCRHAVLRYPDGSGGLQASHQGARVACGLQHLLSWFDPSLWWGGENFSPLAGATGTPLLLLCQGLDAEHSAPGLALQPTLCSMQMSAWSLTQSQHIPSVADGNLPTLNPVFGHQGVQPFPSAAQ